MAKKYGGLGKGLSAIFIENETEDKNDVITLKISQVEPNRNQPRRDFDEESLRELAQSIEEHGVLQPILVRPLLSGGYQIVAGERRYRASRLAGFKEIPAVIRELSDAQTMQLALIENLQRQDLSPLEEAAGYRTLIDEYGLSQEQVAKTVGKSRSAIANTLRLLSLPDEIKELLGSGALSSGHARALLSIEDKSAAIKAAKEAADGKLSVRETEKLAKKYNTPAEKKQKTSKRPLPMIYKEVELTLEEFLGTKVTVDINKNDFGGTIHIQYYDTAQLFSLTQKLNRLWNGGEEEDTTN